MHEFKEIARDAREYQHFFNEIKWFSFKKLVSENFQGYLEHISSHLASMILVISLIS